MSLSISVALCTYNGAAYIEEQLTSILGQSLLPTEIVLSDDGSTDDTVARARRVVAALRVPSVSFVALEGTTNAGVTENFQRALLAARGDLVALSDQDDVWHPDRLSAAVPAFEERSDLLFQHSDARLVAANGAPMGLSLLTALGVSANERQQIAGGRAFNAYIRRNLATGATVLLRRSLIDIASPFPREWVHDEWLGVVAAAVGEVELLERELIDYRQHGANVIGVRTPTLLYRLARMTEPRADRYGRLSARAGKLVERLREIPVPSDIQRLAEAKLRFETIRASMPRHRLARLPQILSEYSRGSYRELSSQGNMDVLRDLMQPDFGSVPVDVVNRVDG